MRWQPLIGAAVALGIPIALLLIAPPETGATTYFLLTLPVIGGVSTAYMAGFRTAWRLELSESDLVVRFPWRSAVVVPLAAVDTIRWKQRARMERGASQWAYLITTAGPKITLWVPRLSRPSLEEFRHALPRAADVRRT